MKPNHQKGHVFYHPNFEQKQKKNQIKRKTNQTAPSPAWWRARQRFWTVSSEGSNIDKAYKQSSHVEKHHKQLKRINQRHQTTYVEATKQQHKSRSSEVENTPPDRKGNGTAGDETTSRQPPVGRWLPPILTTTKPKIITNPWARPVKDQKRGYRTTTQEEQHIQWWNETTAVAVCQQLNRWCSQKGERTAAIWYLHLEQRDLDSVGRKKGGWRRCCFWLRERWERGR